MKHKFRPLLPGDTIDIIAPGSACSQEEVAEALLFVRGLGYTPRVPYNIVEKTEPYHSQLDGVRFDHLYSALLSTDSKAVWCLRGGYGSARLLPLLQDIPQSEQFKWVIGFSDITAIHLFLMKAWQWPVLHAPVLYQINAGKITEESIQKTLNLIAGQVQGLSYTTITPLNKAAKQTQTIQTVITGGNLSLVQTSIGTPWQVAADNYVLFLEEYDEKGYAIDRMLAHLAQAGILTKVKAVLIGDCEGPKDANDAQNIAYAIQRFADTNPSIPVLKIDGIGHGKVNNPLPFGIKCTLTTGEKASLMFNAGDLYE